MNYEIATPYAIGARNDRREKGFPNHRRENGLQRQEGEKLRNDSPHHTA